jgi:hypothetical protein
MSIYEFLYLPHEDGVLEDNGSLASCRKEDILESKTKVLTHIGHGQERTPINATLTVNEDVSCSVSQERVEDLLKSWEPIQNIHEQAVLSIETGVVLGERLSKPHRARFFVCTINDMRNAVLPDEVWR